jgi:hypothetical protein
MIATSCHPGRFWLRRFLMSIQLYRSIAAKLVLRAPAQARAGFCLLGWQPRVDFDPIGGGGAETGLRTSGGRSIDVAKTHVQPHLVVGDVEAGQALIPSCGMENQMLEPTAPPDAVVLAGKRARRV